MDSWLKEKRENAAKTFSAMPLPNHEEYWRRTPLDRFKIESYSPIEEKSPKAALNEAAVFLPSPLTTAGQLLYGEKVSPPTLNESLKDKGVLLTTLTEAAEINHPALQKYFGKGLKNRSEKFLSQNDANWQNGAFCYIPKDVAIQTPLLITGSFAKANTSFFPRILIVLEAGAEATLVHYATSQGGLEKNFANTVFEIYLEDNAHLNFIDIQKFSESTYGIGLKRVELAKNASLNWTLNLQGSKNSKVNLETILNGEGANAKVRGLMNGKGKQQLEIYSYTQHCAPHTTADILIKGTATDKAKTIFQGMIRIEKAAQKTESYMSNNNLVLSETAHCDSIPRLEIEADDVRASHGATVGEVDAEQRFYLQSRGLSQAEAEILLAKGFCEDVFRDISNEEIHNLLRKSLEIGLG